MRYPGGKGKCYHHIINILPPHATYIETHLGGGAVLRRKKPATVSIAVDRDPAVIRRWQNLLPTLATYIEADAVDFLVSRRFRGDELVYCDPPYLSNTRRRDRVYRYDYCEADHVRLLDAILKLPCRVVISGYDSELYNAYLHDWNTTTFKAETQCGIREERLWFNFKPPSWLHDERYLGRNFRERQTIKRRLQRLETRIVALPPQELCALFRRLDNFCQERGQPWRQPKTEEASHYTEREAKLVNHVIQGHITQKDLSTKNGSALQLSLLEGLELELPSGTTNACAEKKSPQREDSAVSPRVRRRIG